jgi:YegS/Rv2252/BmrU family lipid kinase
VSREETLLVVNPQSGGGRTGRTFGSMVPAIERALGPVEVAHTSRRGHAIEIVRDAALARRKLVIAIGGDGTFNEVVNGVMLAGEESDGAKETQVGFIAQGTGGDFRRTLGIEHRLDRYLAAISSGRERKVDVGRMRYKDEAGEDAERWFVNILSAGMGGLVDRYVADAPPQMGGKAAYFAASLRALAACKKGRVRCKVRKDGVDQQRRLASYMIAICNGQYFGSGMHVAPMARVDDGVFEVVSIGAPSKLAFAASSRKIYSGDHLRQRGVEHFECERIELDLENEDARRVFLIDCDGEAMGGLPISIELERGALRLRA